MKYAEGPWWVPVIVMAAILGAICFAPTTSGHAVHGVFHGLGTAFQAAVPDENKPLVVLPSPEGGPPAQFTSQVRSNG